MGFGSSLQRINYSKLQTMGMGVARFDKYLLQRLLLLFGFFSLILVLVFWVNKAVSLLDALMGDGQAVSTFFQLTILGLPSIITTVLPITAFIATVFGINQMSADSELVVVQATGFSPWRLARPVVAFGLVAALMMSVLTHFLVPLSLKEVSARQSEIARDVTARLLTEGQFLHPTGGITVYIRETPDNGELLDIFLSDARSETSRQTYTARRALLVEEQSGPVLLMFDGAAHNYDILTERLSVTTFDSFAYELGSLFGENASIKRKLSSVPTHELLLAPVAVRLDTGQPQIELTRILHNRSAQALLAAVAPIMGFAALIFGGFSRFGLWRYIFLAFALLVVVKALDSAAASQVKKIAENWPVLYMPHLVAIGIFSGLLWLTSYPNTLKFKRTTTFPAADKTTDQTDGAHET
jgi:lipopolysaccharide export system permease protein